MAFLQHYLEGDRVPKSSYRPTGEFRQITLRKRVDKSDHNSLSRAFHALLWQTRMERVLHACQQRVSGVQKVVQDLKKSIAEDKSTRNDASTVNGSHHGSTITPADSMRRGRDAGSTTASNDNRSKSSLGDRSTSREENTGENTTDDVLMDPNTRSVEAKLNTDRMGADPIPDELQASQADSPQNAEAITLDTHRGTYRDIDVPETTTFIARKPPKTGGDGKPPIDGRPPMPPQMIPDPYSPLNDPGCATIERQPLYDSTAGVPVTGFGGERSSGTVVDQHSTRKHVAVKEQVVPSASAATETNKRVSMPAASSEDLQDANSVLDNLFGTNKKKKPPVSKTDPAQTDPTARTEAVLETAKKLIRGTDGGVPSDMRKKYEGAVANAMGGFIARSPSGQSGRPPPKVTLGLATIGSSHRTLSVEAKTPRSGLLNFTPLKNCLVTPREPGTNFAFNPLGRGTSPGTGNIEGGSLLRATHSGFITSPAIGFRDQPLLTKPPSTIAATVPSSVGFPHRGAPPPVTNDGATTARVPGFKVAPKASNIRGQRTANLRAPSHVRVEPNLTLMGNVQSRRKAVDGAPVKGEDVPTSSSSKNSEDPGKGGNQYINSRGRKDLLASDTASSQGSHLSRKSIRGTTVQQKKAKQPTVTSKARIKPKEKARSVATSQPPKMLQTGFQGFGNYGFLSPLSASRGLLDSRRSSTGINAVDRSPAIMQPLFKRSVPSFGGVSSVTPDPTQASALNDAAKQQLLQQQQRQDSTHNNETSGVAPSSNDAVVTVHHPEKTDALGKSIVEPVEEGRPPAESVDSIHSVGSRPAQESDGELPETSAPKEREGHAPATSSSNGGVLQAPPNTGLLGYRNMLPNFQGLQMNRTAPMPMSNQPSEKTQNLAQTTNTAQGMNQAINSSQGMSGNHNGANQTTNAHHSQSHSKQSVVSDGQKKPTQSRNSMPSGSAMARNGPPNFGSTKTDTPSAGPPPSSNNFGQFMLSPRIQISSRGIGESTANANIMAFRNRSQARQPVQTPKTSVPSAGGSGVFPTSTSGMTKTPSGLLISKDTLGSGASSVNPGGLSSGTSNPNAIPNVNVAGSVATSGNSNPNVIGPTVSKDGDSNTQRTGASLPQALPPQSLVTPAFNYREMTFMPSPQAMFRFGHLNISPPVPPMNAPNVQPKLSKK